MQLDIVPVDQTRDAEPGLRGSPSSIEAAVRLQCLARSLRAASFSMLFIAPDEKGRRLLPVFDDSYPAVSPLSRTLSDPAFDRLAQLCVEADTPIWWMAGDGPEVVTPAAQRWSRRVTLDLHGAGVALPLRSASGRVGVAVFVAELGMMLCEDRLSEAHAECYRVFVELTLRRMPAPPALPAMSKREIECLRLTANGMTSDEIAAALGLSVHTANQYLSNSLGKLNAMNRIHAVAKALRLGLIS